GPYPIKALPLHVGIRRPLGVGAGGLAILSAIAPARVEEILKVNAVRYPAYGGMDVAWLRQAIKQTKRDGFSTIAEKATPGMTAIGAPILNPAGEPIGAISIAAISARMPEKRRVALARILRAQCEAVAAAVARTT
ncbi:MAG TPA: IclR family transcriptional regulator C-terminal domain-containing protein, partial [Burkholderiaceae bacterium]|nr:IclR family transcriptional regulator C-terminal domain-containing protein [Burkholderiaceae bacterium]